MVPKPKAGEGVSAPGEDTVSEHRARLSHHSEMRAGRGNADTQDLGLRLATWTWVEQARLG
jgi:hypothetical protein